MTRQLDKIYRLDHAVSKTQKVVLSAFGISAEQVKYKRITLVKFKRKIKMARNISKESLEQKIAKIEKAISKNREQYDRLTAELEELHKKQKAIQSEELLKAIEGSSKSYEEILDFIQGKEKR